MSNGSPASTSKRAALVRATRFLAASLLLPLLPLFTACKTVPGATAETAPEIEFQVGAPFCDNAVLQREVQVPVWGWSTPGDKITVTFAGQTKTAKAGKDGKWMLRLDPLAASFQPRTMTISSSVNQRQHQAKNILVGEVWMCSGQSNMQWKVAKSSCNKLVVEPRDGINPIREFEVTSVYAMLHPIEKATGAWKDGEYTAYSAIAFAFAHKLYGELGVPIGILNCSFSTTAIEAWVPRLGFRDGTDDYTTSVYRKILQTDPATPQHQAAWEKFYEDIEKALAAGKAISTDLPGNMNGNRDASWLFNGRLNPVVPYGMRGAIWNQGYASMGNGILYYNNLHSLVRGWRLKWDNPVLPVYFHQFYSAGMRHAGQEVNKPSIGSSAEMRLGTWMARDIPNAGMASQIDISGGIHYNHKAVPGQRLALHALKNQYGKDVVAEGPMFKSYTVKGNQLIVEFENAEGGLVVAGTAYNAVQKHEDSTGFANPKVIPNGEDRVKLFFLADGDRVWHPASVKIDGERVILTAPGVTTPRGVSYATGEVGFQPNLYNKALLPATPFIYYDNEMVLSKTWPDEKLKIAGETIDPSTIGKSYEYRKMPVLSTQFRDNAVLQAGQPVTIWGIAVHPFNQWGNHITETGEQIVHFSFNGIEKKIPVTEGMTEWQVTVPPMKASAEPKTIKVSFTIDGELVHERVAENVVVGDVWYVAAPTMKMDIPDAKPSGQIVRMMERKAKRDSSNAPSRYSVATSTTPKNRFASYWEDAAGFAGALGHRIAAKTGTPVGIVFMQSSAGGKKGEKNPPIKSWMPPEFLNLAPSLMDDYKQLASLRPGNEYYAENARRYMDAWKTYWNEYIPQMIATKAVPDDAKWGHYPKLAGDVTTKASHTYNVMTHSFTPTALKGVVFLTSADAVEAAEQGATFGEQMTALANAWKTKFGRNPGFFYTMPSQALAPKITAPAGIQGKSTAVLIEDWTDCTSLLDAIMALVYGE